MSKSLVIRSIIIASVASMVMFGALAPKAIAASEDPNAKFCKAPKSALIVVKTVRVMATAYSSTPDQTDDTPFITASGKRVADGIIATNILPFGTKVKIPELYGEKVFVVEDRMHQRKKNQIDIWFSEYQDAKEFGAQVVDIEILQS